MYNEINDALKNVRGYKIVDRIVLEPGIVLVVYENKKAILVNYTNDIYKFDKTIVNPRSWICFEYNSTSLVNGVGRK